VTPKDRALRLDPLPGLAPEEYDALIAELVEDRRRFAASHAFRESDRTHDAINHVTACQLEERKYRLQLAACKDYDEKASEFEDAVRQYDLESARQEDELRHRLAIHRAALVKVHERECALLTEKWNSDTKRRQYNHASMQLRALRKQFRMLMIDCKFQDAEAVKAIMVRTEKAEQAESAAAMQHDFEEAQKKLREKQTGELNYADDAARVQLAQLRQRRLWGRQTFMNKRRKFEKLAGQISDAEKLWNIQQAKRKEELAKRGQVEATVRIARLADEDLPSGEDALITLPPLKMANTV
jgi:hypothetical protein